MSELLKGSLKLKKLKLNVCFPMDIFIEGFSLKKIRLQIFHFYKQSKTQIDLQQIFLFLLVNSGQKVLYLYIHTYLLFVYIKTYHITSRKVLATAAEYMLKSPYR